MPFVSSSAAKFGFGAGDDTWFMELFQAASSNGTLTGARWSTPGCRRAFLVVPGMSGNIIDNTFVWSLGKAACQAGWDLVYGHSRGWGLVSDTQQPDGSWSRGGAAHTRFESGVEDAVFWFDWVSRQYSTVVVVAHSLGAPHTIAAWPQLHHPAGLVLLSPADMPGLAPVVGDPERVAHEVQARRLVSEGAGSTLLDGTLWDWYPIDAQTYLDLRTHGGPADVFPVSRPDTSWSHFEAVDVPLLVTYGEHDDTFIVSVDQDLQTIADHAVNAPHVTTTVIPGAPHNYNPGADLLADTALTWVLQLEM